MVTALLDTSILVDFLRGFPVAVRWLSRQTSVGVTRAVELEVIEGVRDKRGLAGALKLLGEFESFDLIASDFDWAMQQLVRYKLSHNVGMMDCLIASVIDYNCRCIPPISSTLPRYSACKHRNRID